MVVAMGKEMLAKLFGEAAALLSVDLKQSLQDVVLGSGGGGAKAFVGLVTGGNEFVHQAAAAVDSPGQMANKHAQPDYGFADRSQSGISLKRLPPMRILGRKGSHEFGLPAKADRAVSYF